MQLWAMIVDSFRESRDRKTFWVMLLISFAITGAMAAVSFEPNKVVVLFGAWEFETDVLTIGGELRRDIIAGIVVEYITDTVLGSVGVILAIVATAGFIPGFMDKSAIGVLVAKPLPRWRLFMGRYLGGMSFILFHATVFVVLTFLVVGLRWKTWIPGFLLIIPLVVILFSYLYCVSALVGVFAKGTTTCILLTLMAWMFFAGVQTIDDGFLMYPEWRKQRTACHVIHAARWIVPKTQDLTYLAKKWTGAADITQLLPNPDEYDQQLLGLAANAERARMAIPALHTIGSSLLFELGVILLAMWKFSRTDF